MNWIDILIVVIVLLPAWLGFRKGFLRKLLGIAGIALGFVLAVKFYPTVSSLLAVFIKENPTFVNVLAFLLVIGIVYGLAVWLARFIANMNSGTSLVDKILGTVTGFLQGLLMASVLLFNLAIADIPQKKTRETSLLYPTVYKIAPEMFDRIIYYFPGLQDMYNEYLTPKENKNNDPKDPNGKNRQQK